MPLSLKIDVTKLKKEWFFEGKNGAKYAEIVVYENDQPDQYGNSHVVKQNPNQEARQQGAKGPIVGNGKVFGQQRQWQRQQQRPPQRQQRQAPPQQDDGWGDNSSDDIPY